MSLKALVKKKRLVKRKRDDKAFKIMVKCIRILFVFLLICWKNSS